MDLCAQRRKMRVAKIAERRNVKQLSAILHSPSRDMAPIIVTRKPNTHRPANMSSEEIKIQRKIRNRESATDYRNRKRAELEHLTDRIARLEEESAQLKLRLSKYEDVDMEQERCTAIIPATML